MESVPGFGESIWTRQSITQGAVPDSGVHAWSVQEA